MIRILAHEESDTLYINDGDVYIPFHLSQSTKHLVILSSNSSESFMPELLKDVPPVDKMEDVTYLYEPELNGDS